MRLRNLRSAMVTGMVGMLLLAGCTAAPKGGSTPNPTPPSPEPAKEQVVNLYTGRHYAVDDELYAAFTQATGIKVNVVSGKAEELIERLKREGQSSPADLFLTVDGGLLNNAKASGILQPVTSPGIEQNVPPHLRDKENYWIGLSTRARVIAYAKDRVEPADLATYEALTDSKWQGKVLVRSSTSLYNQSLLASFIALNGETAAQQWANGIVANLARKPEGGDRDQIKAIAAGAGDVAIINTYYYGQMLNSSDKAEVDAAQQVGIIFPNQESTGTHINVSGVGLTKSAKNKENAIKLIEFLTDTEAQSTLSQANFEFPVNTKANEPALLSSWGEFKAQQLDFAKLGEQNKKALEIMAKANWQ